MSWQKRSSTWRDAWDAYQKPIGYEDMPEEITNVTIGRVYKEGKEAFGEGKRRGSNPYVERSRALAAIWWNGWDDAEAGARGKGPAQQN